MLEIGALEFIGAQVFALAVYCQTSLVGAEEILANPRLIVEFIMGALFEYSWLLRSVIMYVDRAFHRHCSGAQVNVILRSLKETAQAIVRRMIICQCAA